MSCRGEAYGPIRNRKPAEKKKNTAKTGKPQEISSKTGNRNQRPYWKSFGRLQNLSFFYLTFIGVNLFHRPKFFLRIPVLVQDSS